ncbi:MAG: beta strand repeat-containing protein [Candidatus Kapaibacterium sp.]
MNNLFPCIRIARLTFGIVALMLFSSSLSLWSQNRDFSAERLIIDDDAGDGGYNTMTLQVPPAGLTANRTLIFPDSDGSVVTAAGPLVPNQILFGGPAGQSVQSPNLLWNNGTGIFNIGAGNFTVAAATGNTVIGGTLNLGFTPGSVVFAGAGGVLSQNNNAFFWDNVNEELGAGTNTPSAKLHGLSLLAGVPAIRGDNVAGGVAVAGISDLYGVQGQTNTGVGVYAVSTGAGTGLLAGSNNGPAGAFDNPNAANGNSVVNITNAGAGASLTVYPGTGSAADIRGDIMNTVGDVTIADAAVVTGAIDLRSLVGNTVGDLNLADNVDVTGDLDVGGGNFTVAAATGNTNSAGSVTAATFTGTALPAASTSTNLVTSNGGALETRTIASLSGSVAVSTDATLTGDGTTGNPLGINLANANTWTATQTFPTSAAQGDALIASVNSGTTTIDAARIGAGLTDAQVNDNLTINGGTVDASPVGATTPSTGAFTTLVATGASTLGNGDAGDVLTVNTGGGTDLTISEAGLDRNSGATETLALDNTGAGNINVLINGATSTTNSRLTVDDGHWTSQQTTAPTALPAGANVATTVLANETDVAGFINITTSGTPAAGAQGTVTFNAAYATAPIVVLTAANGAGAGVGAYVTRTTTTFTVNFIGVPAASTSYQFFYQVIETQ